MEGKRAMTVYIPPSERAAMAWECASSNDEPVDESTWMQIVPGVIEQAVAAVDAKQRVAAPQWRPIENNAPKDGTVVDLWVSYPSGKGERCPDCFWSCEDYDDRPHWRQQYAEADASFGVCGSPTYWMLPPEPPKEE